jgi:hypothetical protein
MNNSVVARLSVFSAFVMLGGVASAAAQLGSMTQSDDGISIRLGGFLPSSDGWSSKNTTFAGGLDYRLHAVQLEGTSSTWISITADYFNPQGNRDIPVVVMANSKTGRYTAGVGIGAEDAQFNGNTYIRFAAQASYSYDLISKPLPIFVQAKYFYSSHSEFSGIGLFLGARF